MATGKSKKTPEPGTFEPGLPADAIEVVRLFAIAGRAVTVKPDTLETVTALLAAVSQRLVPPERLAAEECARLWGLFGRMVQRAKPALLEEGGRALYRDLDSLGQKLALPPLESWSALPSGIAAKNPVRIGEESTDRGESLETIRKRAKAKAKKRRDPPLTAPEVLALVSALAEYAREDLFKEVIGAGRLQRSDTTLIDHVVRRRGKVGREDEQLAEGLVAIGRWLNEV